MKVRMLKESKGSPDGIRVETYKVGKSYEIPENLASVFLKLGWAEKDKSLKGPKESKDEVKVKNSTIQRASKFIRGKKLSKN